MKIKKGDQVKILSGKDRNKTGKVVKTMPQLGRVLVEGLNLHKKHVRSRQAEKKGEVISVPAPVSSARVQLICPHCGKAVRIAYELTGEGKARICKKCRHVL